MFLWLCFYSWPLRKELMLALAFGSQKYLYRLDYARLRQASSGHYEGFPKWPWKSESINLCSCVWLWLVAFEKRRISKDWVAIDCGRLELASSGYGSSSSRLMTLKLSLKSHPFFCFETLSSQLTNARHHSNIGWDSHEFHCTFIQLKRHHHLPLIHLILCFREKVLK